MYRVPLSPRNLKKLGQEKILKKFLPIPDRWEDFAQLCKIKSGNQMVNFNPYLYQIQLSDLMDNYNNITVVKSRQLGITQAIISKFLHRAIKNPAYSAMVFLKNQEDSSNIARRARVMLASLSDYCENESDNLGYMKISNGGELYFKNSAKDGGRSYDSVSDFLFDEAAFSPNISDIYSSASSASAMVGDDCTKMVISTPSAKFGWYWDKLIEGNSEDIEEICKKVVSGELPPFHYLVNANNDVKCIIHWKAHPIYSKRDDYLEYRKAKDGTSWEVVNHEYNLTFVDSEVSVFSSEIVRNNIVSFIPESPKKCKYYIGVDTANLGSDYTVAVVLMLIEDTYYLVDMYRKRKMSSDYDIFAIGELIKKYKPEKVGIEITGGTGQIYLEQLAKEFKSTAIEAIRTTGDSKPAMIDRLILALEKSSLKYLSNSPLIEELLTFRRVGNKLEASAGKHDDCVMGVCFALAVSPFKAKKNVFFGFTSVDMSGY